MDPVNETLFRILPCDQARNAMKPVSGKHHCVDTPLSA